MRVFTSGLLVFALAACSTPGASGPSPGALLRDSSAAMSKLSTLTADLTFGPGVTFQGFTLASAQTRVKLPGDSDSTFKVKQNDFLVDVRVVSVGGQIFLKVPFSAFTQLAPEQAASLPDPAALFDPAKGLPSLLAKGHSLSSGGSETVAGVDCDRVNAVYSAADIGAALPAIKPAGDVRTTFWIGKKDHLVRRALLTGDLLAPGKPTTVEVKLHDFDAPLDIAKPTVSAAAG